MLLGVHGSNFTLTSGISKSPFYVVCSSEETSGQTLNGDYSVTSNTFSYTFTRSAVVCRLSYFVNNESIAQSRTFASTHWSDSQAAMENGLDITIKDSSGTVVQDLRSTYKYKRTMDIDGYSSLVFALNSATANNTEFHLYCERIPLDLFGGHILIPANHKFSVFVNDNVGTTMRFALSGYYL